MRHQKHNRLINTVAFAITPVTFSSSGLCRFSKDKAICDLCISSNQERLEFQKDAPLRTSYAQKIPVNVTGPDVCLHWCVYGLSTEITSSIKFIQLNRLVWISMLLPSFVLLWEQWWAQWRRCRCRWGLLPTRRKSNQHVTAVDSRRMNRNTSTIKLILGKLLLHCIIGIMWNM